MPADLASSDTAVGQQAAERCGSNLEPHYLEADMAPARDDDALFNDNVLDGSQKLPVLKREQIHQRMMVLLKAQGYSNVEIAQQLGYSPVTVNYVLRQPWARERLVKLVMEKGQEGVDSILKAELVPSLLKIVEVRDDPTSKKGEVLAASQALIDRFLGKPTQRVETSQAPKSADIEQLKHELETLQEEEQRLRRS